MGVVVVLVYVIFTIYKQTLLKEHSRSFKKNRDHANIIIYYINNY